MIVLVMGVSGAGKTAIGVRLAQRLGFRFIDADDHHPAGNVAKMAAGIPLDDADRRPWLEKLNALLKEEKDAVLACSALKQSYRDVLSGGVDDFRTIFLNPDPTLIRARLEARKHRYMPASLLASQLSTLEPPRASIEIDVTGDVEACVAKIAKALG
jgi:gluconokinase